MYELVQHRDNGARGWLFVALGGATLVTAALVLVNRRQPRGAPLSARGLIIPLRAGTNPEAEIDALARLVNIETVGMRQSEREAAAIAHTAVNRAKLYGASVHQVAYNAVPGRQKWNVSSNWNSWMAGRGPQHRGYAASRRVAEAVLYGRFPNEIGDRTQFIHHKTQERLGRARPSWAISKRDGGSARREPIVVDEALFS